MRRWLRPGQRRPGVPSGGSVGILLSWAAGDCSCRVSKQEKKAVPIVGMCVPVHLWFAGDGSATAAGVGDGSDTAAGVGDGSETAAGVGDG